MLNTPYQGVGKLRTFPHQQAIRLFPCDYDPPTPIDELVILERAKIGFRNADSLIKNGTVANDLKRVPIAL
jgi:hypothetical protein